MKNSLLIALTFTACTSSMHAAITLTKARTLAQTAATYARTNKLKTTGMMIGGILATDVLQTVVRYAYYQSPHMQDRKKRAEAKYRAAEGERAKAEHEIKIEPFRHININQSLTGEEANAMVAADEKYNADPRVKAYKETYDAYLKSQFNKYDVSFSLGAARKLQDEWGDLRLYGLRDYLKRYPDFVLRLYDRITKLIP
jgi:hypothetical protein